MAFNVDDLSAYVEQNEKELVASSILGAKTADLIKQGGNVMVGVKSSKTINTMDTDAIFQAGGSCGFSASGETSFSQREVEVGKIKVNEALCPSDLEDYYLQKALVSGSKYDSVPFEKEYAERKASKIAAQLEKAIWQGDKTSVDVNLNKFTGFIKLLSTEAGVVDSNHADYGGTWSGSITISNALAIFEGVYRAIPAQVVDKDDMRIFCGQDAFRAYSVALRNANLFHYSMDAAANSEFVLPGTNIKVVAVSGLNGSNKLYAMRLSNMYIGTDMLDEKEKFEIFHAKEADEVRFDARFKFGVQVAFPDEIVRFKF